MPSRPISYYFFINHTQECQLQMKYLSKLTYFCKSIFHRFIRFSNEEKTYFSEMFLVDNLFFFSKRRSKKNYECTECESSASSAPPKGLDY